MTDARTLTLSHSPDPDDAFAWWGILSGAVEAPGLRFECTPRTMQQANEACLAGEVDIAAISSAAWPHFSDRYAVLDVGASVGRGYGPALAAREHIDPRHLRGCTVALPGDMTTGAMLFRLMHPEARSVCMPCSAIAPAVLSGEVDAGVLIHEELMNHAHRGLARIECLGKSWEQETGLPIPVGLVVVRRSLGLRIHALVATALRASILAAFEHRDEALRHAMRFTCQASDGIGEEFVGMFTNADSLHLDAGCIEALRLLYARSFAVGLTPCLPAVRPIAPTVAAADAIHA